MKFASFKFKKDLDIELSKHDIHTIGSENHQNFILSESDFLAPLKQKYANRHLCISSKFKQQGINKNHVKMNKYLKVPLKIKID